MMLLLTGAAVAGMGEPPLYGLVRIDQAEWAPTARTLTVSADAFFGGDVHRLWVSAEGDLLPDASSFESQLLGSRLFSPWWEAQAGVRLDFDADGVQPWGVLGLEGLAPYWFEVTPQLFFGEEGVAGRVTAERDLFVTQRLIATPEVELEAGSGWDGALASEVRLDLRLRYEIAREFAPYAGIGWAMSSTSPTAESELVIGLRAWF